MMSQQGRLFHVLSLREKAAPYAALVCCLNEGERLHKQLERMREACRGNFDIIIADGPSTDGSTAADTLKQFDVRAVVQLDARAGLSAALLSAISFSVESGYAGYVIMDGNNKDDERAFATFRARLDEGFDYVQGSRFAQGGADENTPASRWALIRLIHAPAISLVCGRWFGDTTNGFRAFSASFTKNVLNHLRLLDFCEYELPYYLAWLACRAGYRVTEIPVIRSYPATGPIPTKIHGWRGYWRMLKPILVVFLAQLRVAPYAARPLFNRTPGTAATELRR